MNSNIVKPNKLKFTQNNQHIQLRSGLKFLKNLKIIADRCFQSAIL